MFTLALDISRSITIDKPVVQVRQALVNFKTWNHWSPWLCMDKQARIEFFGETGAVDSGYRWSGQWVGEGRLQLKAKTEDSVEMSLEFLKPWKSTAKTFFKLVSVGDKSTEVTWTMHGGLPIFLFFMKSMMQSLIGMDYQRGLSMLKDYLETGSVLSDTEVAGIVEMPGADYVGVRRTCALADIGPDMETAVTDLLARFNQTELKQSGPPFSIYHDWNIKTQRCDYSFALPIESGSKAATDDFLIKSFRPAVKALKLRHTGDYKHLGNAWATGYSRIQNDKSLKLNKKQAAFEIYVNDPEKAAAKDLVTEVYIPVL